MSKVVHVIAPYLFGGAEAVVGALAVAASRAGHEVDVVAIVPEGGKHPFVQQLQSVGVSTMQISCGRRRYRAEVSALAAYLRNSKPEVVHTHLCHADVVGFCAARRCGLPIVSTVHGITGSGWKNTAYVWLDLLFLRRFDAVICVSEELRCRLVNSGCRHDRVHLVPNGYLDLPSLERHAAREVLGIRSDARVIGWVGRLSYEKGPDLFIDALVPLAKEGVIAILIGTGPAHESVLHHAARLGISDSVRCIGHYANAAELLRAFDVLVLSSRTEASPMVILEAMAAGVPIVAFAVGNIPELLTDEAAWLVPATETAALSGAMQEALLHPSEATKRARKAQQILSETSDAQRWIETMQRIYDTVAVN